MNVYNIVWADDEIDDFLDESYIEDLRSIGFEIVGKARNGYELEKCLKQENQIDAVIVDANFNEALQSTNNEHDISGLIYARSLYLHRLEKKIPFYLFTNRTDELLHEITKDNPSYLEDFPRHKRWFSKYLREERDEMFETIKKDVDDINSAGFIIRNRLKEELNAATLIEDAKDFIYEFSTRDIEDSLSEMVEPFVRARRIVEQIFTQLEKMCIIPSVSDDFNGTANYFLYNAYSKKDKIYNQWDKLYTMSVEIMPKPLAQSLEYFANITQDGAHSKGKLNLKVDQYFKRTKDVHLLRSIAYIVMDLIKWHARTILDNRNIEQNKERLWKKV